MTLVYFDSCNNFTRWGAFGPTAYISVANRFQWTFGVRSCHSKLEEYSPRKLQSLRSCVSGASLSNMGSVSHLNLFLYVDSLWLEGTHRSDFILMIFSAVFSYQGHCVALKINMKHFPMCKQDCVCAV